LEEGIDGLVHVSDLSWTRKIKHPSEFIRVGESLEVIVLELDTENKRLALGHKQLEENPWDTFETVFTVGSTQRCTIMNKHEKGATLELPYGIEGFAPIKQLMKEDGTEAEAGEALDFVVIEFLKDEKRIVLSHTRTYKVADAKEEQEKQEKDAKRAAKKAKTDSEAPETLGDLSDLAALKEQMEKGA
jgi:small subunit ribosomal protein S1